MAILRVLLTLLLMSAVISPAAADDLVIGEEKIPIIGYAITKSTSGRLVNVLSNNPLADAKQTVKGVYIPAGTRVAILDRSYSDRQRRPWNLVVTEDGILAFVRGKGKHGEAHYWTEDQIGQFFRDGASAIAIIQTPLDIESKEYGKLKLTVSEIYKVDSSVRSGVFDEVPVVLERAKVGEKWTKDEAISVSEGAVVLVYPDTFTDKADIARPFRRYDPGKEILGAVEATIEQKSVPDAENVRKAVRAFLASRFLTSKNCESEIALSIDAGVALAVDLSSLLSPVEAKLKISGDLKGATKYEKGEEFVIQRVFQPDRDTIYEIKRNMIRPNCAASPSGSRITVAGTDGAEGEINAANLKDAGFEDAPVSAVYTCRSEFFALRDILANKYFLPQDISTFVVANFSEFKGAKDPSSCEK
jgi:hypothetical protein